MYRCFRRISAAAIVAAGLVPAAAQDYPSRQIDIVVPFVAGGTTDTIARALGQRLNEKFGQPVIITNRPGAGGSIATASVAKSPPDGYTLLAHTIGFATGPSMQKQLYDAIQDFTPVTQIASLPLMLVVHPSLPVQSVAELIALAKEKPGQLDFASAGMGTSPHLAAEMFKQMTGTNLVHIPFKGNAEVMNAMLGGHVKVYFSLVPATLSQVKAGNVRALAVTTERRIAALPDVPTMMELGFAGYEINSWQGLFVPAGTPKPVVTKLNEEVTAILRSRDMHARIENEGADPVGSTPEQFASFVKAEVAKWDKVIKSAGISAAN
jgi:tripartite-type tricarboxylate transporter receptor subunit TctC